MFAARLRLAYRPDRHGPQPEYKAERSVLRHGSQRKTRHRRRPAVTPASHQENDALLPASGFPQEYARRRDGHPPDAAPARLCGWWYPGRCARPAHREITCLAAAQAVPSLRPPVTGELNHIVDTGWAAAAGCHNGGSATDDDVDAECNSDRSAGIRQSSRSRGRAAQVKNHGGSGTATPGYLLSDAGAF